jgi:hypothetical protein
MPTERNAWEREVSRELGEIKALLVPMQKHEERICVLERWRFKSTVIASAAAFVVGKLTHTIDPLLSGFSALLNR